MGKRFQVRPTSADPRGPYAVGVETGLGRFVPMDHCATKAQADKLAAHWNRLTAGGGKKKPAAGRVSRAT